MWMTPWQLSAPNLSKNRPTPISKPTTLSQAEALNYSRGTLVFVTFNMAAFVYIVRALVLTPFLACSKMTLHLNYIVYAVKYGLQ